MSSTLPTRPPTLEDFWPLDVGYRCPRCNKALLSEGPCKNPRCTGRAVEVRGIRARCRCTNWTVGPKTLGSRCKACHRKIEAWDPATLLDWLKWRNDCG